VPAEQVKRCVELLSGMGQELLWTNGQELGQRLVADVQERRAIESQQ
jgi:hypothetical protein